MHITSAFRPTPFPRRMLRRRILRLIPLVFMVLSTAEALWAQRRLVDSDTAQRDAIPSGESVYIASIHWNNEGILHGDWNKAILELAKELGRENVYISVFESGSWDGTKDALYDLDRSLGNLGIARNITVSERTHEMEISAPPTEQGWVDTPQGRKELRRIPYLARQRNLSLQPLHALRANGITFDKILFLNDVVFTTQDVLNLIDTNQGQYAAACSLDFSEPPFFYDTFALRDSLGEEAIMQKWPFFRSSASLKAMKGMSPVPVASCWNGMVSMPARPFYADPPLQFRGIPDSLAHMHVEGSECCLIHADNPLSEEQGVYLNPRVRVGYSRAAYTLVHPASRWLSAWQVFISLWENRIRRIVTTTFFKDQVIQSVNSRWEAQDKGNRELGRFCLIDEMQVLRAIGWAHV